MSAGNIKLQASDLRVATVTFEDGAAGNVNVVVPKEGGVLASEDYAVAKVGDVTKSGVMTFSSSPIVPTPTTSTQVASKGYVDSLNTTWVANDSRAKTALNASGTAPIYACRAWVNFNGTGTVAIRESGNVSSITDNGTGDYTVNFTTAMVDANYATNVTRARSDANATTSVLSSGVSISGIRVRTAISSTASAEDADYIFVSIFR